MRVIAGLGFLILALTGCQNGNSISLASSENSSAVSSSTSSSTPVSDTTSTVGAQINEASETAVFYVDPVKGKDSNPGSSALPFQTFEKGFSTGLTNGAKKIGTKIILNPGTYRENILFYGSGTYAPVTVEAATPGTAIMTGADIYTGWKATTPSNVYEHSWTNTWGECVNASTLTGWPQPIEPIMLRREMVIVNGKLLTQVMSKNQLVSRTFYVDEINHLIFINPPSGVNMTTAMVEVTTRQSLLELHDVNNLVLRGITFQYAGSCNTGSVTSHAVYITGATSTNVLIDNDHFLWNNSNGLRLDADNSTVQNSVANHNGSMGMASYDAQNTLWQNNDSSYNNWRGAQSEYYGWNDDAIDIFGSHTTTFYHHTAYYNQSQGLHFDTDNVNLTLTGLYTYNNLRSGVIDEANPGPVALENAHICNNNPLNQPYDGGININDSNHLNLRGNYFYNNGKAQVILNGAGRAVTDWVTGVTIPHNYIGNITSSYNVVEGLGSQYLFRTYWLTTDPRWVNFQKTLDSYANDWWNSSNATKAFNVGSIISNFAEWESVSGQDPASSSKFAVPTANLGSVCTPPTPDQPDFWSNIMIPVVTISKGQTATYEIQFVPIGFSGSVSLVLDGVSEIKGATSKLSSSSVSITSAVATSTLSIVSSSSTPSGTYPITIMAVSGGITHTATVSLIVQ